MLGFGKLQWSKENKKSWQTDGHRAKPLRKAFRGKLMAEITPFLVEKYKMGRAKEVVKSTVNKEVILGSQVFMKAKEWCKFQGENPFIGNQFKIPKPKKPGSITPDQVQGIMDEITHSVKRDMVNFAFNSGWRIGEIRKLKWEDVDLEKGLAWIVDPKTKVASK